MPQVYGAIIVGARCAGSPLAMLLAREGYRVLVVGSRDVPPAMDALARMNAGTISPAEFGAIVAAAQPPGLSRSQT
jgi:flavin-dependent dehydrogenase